ncbi:AbfB domain-containing protein [Nonomuraea sp. 3-1Str]|nr:AbfB domain-containing protein [Nonomuraea sp. 3-1Str]
MFERDATFHARPAAGSGRPRLESADYPGRFVRHRHRHHQLWLDKDQDSSAFRAGTTFRPTAP